MYEGARVVERERRKKKGKMQDVKMEHRHFYTQTFLHRNTFTHTRLTHRFFFIDKRFYTQTPFKKEIHQNSRKCRFMCLF
jgi:hypothetical protein